MSAILMVFNVMSAQTAFISGPLDSPTEYFETHYVPRILATIAAGDNFVIGPVRGVDTQALHFLLSSPQNVSPSRITIFMTHAEYATKSWREQYEVLGVGIREAGVTTRDRDAAMTMNSSYDILRYRTEEECKMLYGDLWWPRVSNTEMNERRRMASKGEEAPKGYLKQEIDKMPNMSFREKLSNLFSERKS